MSDHEISVTMEHIKDFQFKVTFDDKLNSLVMDEPPPLGSDKGPNATNVLSAAIANCLTASLLFCLTKTRVKPISLTTTVTTHTSRDDNKRIRINDSHVSIALDLADEDQNRLSRCTNLFEDYCIVSQSIRQGIDISVDIRDRQGEIIYDSRDESGGD